MGSPLVTPTPCTRVSFLIYRAKIICYVAEVEKPAHYASNARNPTVNFLETMIKNQKMLIDQVYIKRKPKYLFEVPGTKKAINVKNNRTMRKSMSSVFHRQESKKVSFLHG